jgi:excisionase family DNA binding protein
MTTTAPQLTITQARAAKRFGVSTRTIRRWEERGLIKGTKVGGLKLYPFARIAWLVGLRKGTKDQL